MKQFHLIFLPQFNAFGIADEKIAELERKQIVPELTLSPADYERLECPQPNADAPIVVMLLGREKDYFAADYNYVLALATTGVNIRFLTFERYVSQLFGSHGLLLPGGSFSSPERYYTDGGDDAGHGNYPCARAKAYALCIHAAAQMDMPMLEICTGAQTIAAEFGMKLCRTPKSAELFPIAHKSAEHHAHLVNIFQNTPLAEIFDNQAQVMVNSRHSETLCGQNFHAGFSVYAAADDGVPEAWGAEDKHILCIQWHPEDYAAKGDVQM